MVEFDWRPKPTWLFQKQKTILIQKHCSTPTGEYHFEFYILVCVISRHICEPIFVDDLETNSDQVFCQSKDSQTQNFLSLQLIVAAQS